MMRDRAPSSEWRIGTGRTIALDRPVIMGILNVTPDSFSDGGQFTTVDAAVDRAQAMCRDGAVIIDVGGESTRPGADRVSAGAQIERVVPVIQRLTELTDAAISVDTTRAAVAEAALDAGAVIINDVAAGQEDDAMLSVVAGAGAGLILMHRLHPPDADSYSDQYAQPPAYEDVVADVSAFLVERAGAAVDAGVHRDAIMGDPGLGFGKTVAQNYELIARTSELLTLTGLPMLAASSRKSFIGRISAVAQAAERDAGSLAAACWQYHQGARVFRVHDVARTRQALAVAAAIRDAAIAPMRESSALDARSS